MPEILSVKTSIFKASPAGAKIFVLREGMDSIKFLTNINLMEVNL